MAQVLRRILPRLEAVVHALVGEAGDPLAQGSLTLLLKCIGDPSALIFAPHELICRRTLQLLDVIHLIDQLSLLLFKHHDCLTLFKLFPAAERAVLIVLVEAIDERFQESLRYTVLLREIFDRVIRALFLFEFKADLDFTKFALISILLLPTGHSIPIFVPRLAKQASSHLGKNMLRSIHLSH